MKLPEAKQIGMVFSGGGVRGMAHIGVLKALQEHNISPHWIAGSSVGALVGALYAKGRSVSEMLSFFKETPLFRYNFFSFGKPGLMDTDRYHRVFEEYWPENSFEALPKPLFVVATDILRGKEAFFSKGELIRPLLASAALPPLFSPVRLNNQLYSDGGIMNNFPLEPIQERASFVIGSNVSVIKEVQDSEIRSSFQLANRTTALMLYAINREKINNCDLIFEPIALEKIGVLDKKGIEKAFEIGYSHASKVLEEKAL
ncbi:patatin-like phospholipase family protein [Robiginitalea sp. IMCC43444]|uniref:patatin-like phospholipase family protein n=1 Tax=Robiginitalea sp. IMCC43444 TaxID=3459121 RepID=UPI0040431025